MSDVVVSLKNISKTYSIRERQANSIKGLFFNLFASKKGPRKINALSDINLEVKKGQALGIIGRNGSGKSTLLNIILGGIRPDEGGTRYVNGRIVKLQLGIGFDANLSARDNIQLNGTLLGLSFEYINEHFDEIIKYAGLEKFIETPIKFFSKGMKARLSFSIAMHAEADIFLLDEFFGGVGDEEFKNKSNQMFLNKLNEGKTLIIVSHGKSVLAEFCKETVWIDGGKIRKHDKTKKILKEYKALYKIPKENKKNEKKNVNET